MYSRLEINHNALKGIDVNIEISLKKYGFAWIELETEYLFYYGIGRNRFDFCAMDKDTDIKKEFDWIANWNDFDLSLPMPMIIFGLYTYYGSENIFGTSYYEGLTYKEVLNGL